MGRLDDAARVVHAALGEYLDDGEIAVSWAVVIEVAGQDGSRYLAHRFGGGVDGTERPTVWSVAGLIEAAHVDVQDELRATRGTPLDEDGNEQDGPP